MQQEGFKKQDCTCYRRCWIDGTLAEKQIISMILYSIIENKSYLPFLSFWYVLSMLLNFGLFSASFSYRRSSYRCMLTLKIDPRSGRGGEWSSEKWEVSANSTQSQNLTQPANGSRSLRFCICRSHICFSIKSLNFSVSVSDFKMPVSASRPVTDLPFATPGLQVELNLMILVIFNTADN